MTVVPDDAVRTGSTERFGFSWSTYDRILPDHEGQFQRWTTLVRREEWIGATFLDVGCGIGRNTFWPARYGAARGIAVDLDERTLATARRNLAELPNVEVRQGSAYDLEALGPVDIAFSIGVIHHLADPARALDQMRRAVRPGGTVLIWVYGYEGNEWVARYFDPLRRRIFARLPVGAKHVLSLPLTTALWTAVRAGYAPTEYMRTLRSYGFDQLRVIVFDQMLPRIANYWRRDEVRALMEGAGLVDVELAQVNDISWCARGRRPE